MSPSEAITRVSEEVAKRPLLKIIAVSGPGEPLFTAAAIQTLRALRNEYPDMEFCLSTNGTLLEHSAGALADLRVRTVSVSMSTIRPEIASALYQTALLDGTQYTGLEMGRLVINRQLAGIRAATDQGILVKVNSVMIPGLTIGDIESVAEAISHAGASLQNIVPLVPAGQLSDVEPPLPDMIIWARQQASKHIPQFSHCKQCRSDVVGIPGQDTPL
jgi:nitrogen fixation protein NifB